MMINFNAKKEKKKKKLILLNSILELSV